MSEHTTTATTPEQKVGLIAAEQRLFALQRAVAAEANFLATLDIDPDRDPSLARAFQALVEADAAVRTAQSAVLTVAYR